MFLPHTYVLSVKVCTLSKSGIKKELADMLRHEKGFSVFTPNPQMLLAADKDRRLCELLNSSSLNIPDGVGVRIAARLKNNIRVAKTSGIDLAEELLPLAERIGTRVFLLGGKPGVATEAKKNILKRFPNLNICGTQHGYFKEDRAEAINKKIRDSRAELLLVCMGFPRQEEWIAQNISSLTDVRMAIGLGGTLDVWAKRTRRAPKAVQDMGLEWFWRTILDPSRAKIFIDIPRFLLLLAKEKKQVY